MNDARDLVNGCYIVVGIGWCLRGKEDHALLADGEIKFLADEQGPYVSLSPHFLKNHSEQVGSGGQHDRQEPRRLYQLEQDNPHDGYNMMNLYRSHKPVGHEGRFYLYPSKKTPSLREKDSKGSPSWYASNTPIGHNELGKIVKELCTRVGQPVPAGGLGKWGGQGLRRTALTNCAEGGMNDTQKMKAGGHRSKQGLMKYIDISGGSAMKISKASFQGSGCALDLLVAQADVERSKLRSNELVHERIIPQSFQYHQSRDNQSPFTSVPQITAQVVGLLEETSIPQKNATHFGAQAHSVFPAHSSNHGMPQLVSLREETSVPQIHTTHFGNQAYSAQSSNHGMPQVVGLHEEMKDLKAIFDEGYITKDQYEDAKIKVLRSRGLSSFFKKRRHFVFIHFYKVYISFFCTLNYRKNLKFDCEIAVWIKKKKNRGLVLEIPDRLYSN